MVIGGGGGLHQPLKEGAGCLPDLSTDYKPMFHYLTVKRVAGHLQVTSLQLNNDFSAFEEGVAVSIQKPVDVSIATGNKAENKSLTSTGVNQPLSNK